MIGALRSARDWSQKYEHISPSCHVKFIVNSIITIDLENGRCCCRARDETCWFPPGARQVSSPRREQPVSIAQPLRTARCSPPPPWRKPTWVPSLSLYTEDIYEDYEKRKAGLVRALTEGGRGAQPGTHRAFTCVSSAVCTYAFPFFDAPHNNPRISPMSSQTWRTSTPRATRRRKICAYTVRPSHSASNDATRTISLSQARVMLINRILCCSGGSQTLFRPCPRKQIDLDQ